MKNHESQQENAILFAMKPLGLLIREKRQARGLSLREAAKHMSISHVYLKKIEDGQKNPTIDVLNRIFKVLNINLNRALKKVILGYDPFSPLSFIEEMAEKERGKIRPIPIFNWKMAKKNSMICDKEVRKKQIRRKYIISDIPGPFVFALEIEDKEMEPEFKIGEIITVSPHIGFQNYDFVVASIKNNEEAVLRQVVLHNKNLILRHIYKAYPEIEISLSEFKKRTYQIIGVVAKKEVYYKGQIYNRLK